VSCWLLSASECSLNLLILSDATVKGYSRRGVMYVVISSVIRSSYGLFVTTGKLEKALIERIHRELIRNCT